LALGLSDLDVNVKITELGLSSIYPGLTGLSIFSHGLAESDIPSVANLENCVI
jgi:hypothetical protein